MITVKDLLNSGWGTVLEITPTDTAYRALQLMVENNTGLVAVTDGGSMVGIFTDGDFFQNISRSSLHTPVSEIMTKNVITVHPEQTLEECLELMTRHRIHHLLVTDRERLIGKVSKHDVMESIITAKQDLIERLENYIVSADYGR